MVCAACLPVAFAPARADPSDSIPAGRWVVDWGDTRCSLIRRNDGQPASIFALRTTPGTGRWEIRLLNPDWPRVVYDSPERIRVTLEPQGRLLEGEMEATETPLGRAIVVDELEEETLSAFVGAQAIRVDRGDERILDMRLPGLSIGMNALRDCVDEVMLEWGIDPAAFAALRTRPRGNIAAVFEHDDYPFDALTKNHEGTSVFRMTIDRGGRVMDCATVLSSGHDDLDERACSVVRQRLRVEPGIGPDGNPTVAPMVAKITWRIY